MSLVIQNDVSLAEYCTMRLGGSAKYLSTINNKDELVEAVNWSKAQSTKLLIIGSGSNTIFKDSGFEGLVCFNKIAGIEKIDEDVTSVTLKVGSGEIWDDFAKYSVKKNLSGIEALSLIPGTVGAAPVQNIGAYGQEVADTILEVEAYDSRKNKFVSINNKELKFGYRSSKLKVPIEQRHLYIASVTFRLSKKMILARPLYEPLEKFYTENNIDKITPQNIRQVVISVRSAKLPDPQYVANSGSFFTNPIISSEKHLKLKFENTNIKSWQVGNNEYKISAGWLIESAGLSNFEHKGISFYPLQHLVVVNKSAKSTQNLIAFRDMVINRIEEKFGIFLKQEPELI